MNVTITPTKLHGTIAAVPAKSDLHRALICAAFADGPTTIRQPSPAPLSQDIEATVECLTALGAEITFTCEPAGTVLSGSEPTGTEPTGTVLRGPDVRVAELTITPIRKVPDNVTLRCGESGSTARFMLPIVAAVCKNARFEGSGRLPERPMSPLTDELARHGCRCSSSHLPINLTGYKKADSDSMAPADAGAADSDNMPSADTREADSDNVSTAAAKEALPSSAPEFTLPGSISSQFITGLLLAAPLMGGVRIHLTTALASASYVDMTIDTMQRFGVHVRKTEDGFAVDPSAYRTPGIYMTDGGWSSAAFFIAANILSSENTEADAFSKETSGPGHTVLMHTASEHTVSVANLRKESLQGDRVIAEIAARFRDRRQKYFSAAQELMIDADNIPDLVPIIAVMASLTPGITRIINAARLRLKESDRLRTTAEMLTALGADVTELDDGLLISGKEALQGGTVSGYNDHRIVMSAAIASIGCTNDVTILGAEAVAKSYPGFWDDFTVLGGRIRM